MRTSSLQKSAPKQFSASRATTPESSRRGSRDTSESPASLRTPPANQFKIHRSHQRPQDMDVLPPRLVPRNGQRPDEPILTNHQLLRLLSSGNNSTWMCHRRYCIHLPWYRRLVAGLHEELPSVDLRCSIHPASYLLHLAFR